MSNAQGSYERLTEKGFNGALADLNPTEIIAEAAEGAVAFGTAVSRSGSGVASGGTTPIGIAIRDLSRQANTAGSADFEYDDEEAVNILREGYIFLSIVSGGTVGDALFSTDATGIVDAGTAGAGETQLNATLEETVTAGEIARCRIEL